MIKKIDRQTADKQKILAKAKYTNRLFLDLLYNLSKYPHAKAAKRLVRQGLFDFEEKNVFCHKKDR